MKKTLVIILTALICATFVSCSENAVAESSAPESSKEESSVVETPDDSEAQVPAGDILVGDIPVGTAGSSGVIIAGQSLEIGSIITADMLTALGEPLETQQAPSCHFDGNDTIYLFGDFTLYLYKDGDKDVLYILELNSNVYQTALGGRVGMTREEIVELYGDDFTEQGTRISYAMENEVVDFTIDESGNVSLIELLETE